MRSHIAFERDCSNPGSAGTIFTWKLADPSQRLPIHPEEALRSLQELQRKLSSIYNESLRRGDCNWIPIVVYWNRESTFLHTQEEWNDIEAHPAIPIDRGCINGKPGSHHAVRKGQ